MICKIFDKAKCMSFLMKDKQLKNIIRYGIKLLTLLTKALIINQFIIINIKKLK